MDTKKNGKHLKISHLIQGQTVLRQEASLSRVSTKNRKANISTDLKVRIIDLAYDPVLLYLPGGEIIYSNKAAANLYGYTQNELNNLNTRQLIPPEEINQYQARINTVLETGQVAAEANHRHKNGTIFPVETHSRLVNTPGSQYILSLIRDVTERRKIEQNNKQNELLLQNILDALTEGVALIGTDGIILKANKAEATILGLKSPEERIGLHVLDPNWQLIYPDGSPLPENETAIFTAMKRKRGIRNFEMGIVNKATGQTIWLNINAVPIIDGSGKVLGVVRTMTEISEQKRLLDEREQFTKKILAVQEEERKRISRDLHDDTAQHLALLILEMDSFINREVLWPPDTLSRLQRLYSTAKKALEEVRRFSHELRPSVLEDSGLTAALELIVGEFKSSTGIAINIDIEGAERRLTDENELTLFRIAQEALNNIRKHSQATKADINLKFLPHKVFLTITDNGKGFNTSANNPLGKGSLGLIGMRERAHLIGAVLKIKSKPGQGTTVSIDVNTT